MPSAGDFLARVITTRSAVKLRKRIVADSASGGAEKHRLPGVEEASFQNTRDVRLPLFVTLSEVSQAAGPAFVDRATARRHVR